MLRNTLWWGGYIIVAIWLQKLMPGLDALIPGFLVCLQERNKHQTAAFALISVLIQEGAGTFPFGLSLLWHGTVVALYYLGVWFFLSGSPMFILLLSLAVGVCRLVFFPLMDFLRHTPLDLRTIFQIFALQLFFTPLLWGLAGKLREGSASDANQH